VKIKKNNERRSKGDKIFDTVNLILMTLFLIIMLYPLYYVVIASISDIHQVGLGNVIWRPIGFNLQAYIEVLNHRPLWIGYRNSLLYTVLTVLYQLAIMLPLAYALSKKYLFAKGVFTWLFLVPMFFSGGIIPAFLLRMVWMDWGNTIRVLVVGSVSAWNLIVTRTFFANSIPDELYESAEIDGASQFRCFFQIALPLSKPIIAVMALFIGVGAWNAFFAAMIYLTDRSMWPLQLVIRSILLLNEAIPVDPEVLAAMSPDQMADMLTRQNLALSMRFSTVFIASAPLLIAYPFVQKYFVRGVMIGSLKG